MASSNTAAVVARTAYESAAKGVLAAARAAAAQGVETATRPAQAVLKVLDGATTRMQTPAFMAAVGILIVTGGPTIRRQVRAALREQRAICAEAGVEAARKPGGGGAAVPAADKRFALRMIEILRICVPTVLSEEAFLISAQTVLLIGRTLLTDVIAELEGKCSRNLVSSEYGRFARGVANFAAVAVPAALVNSALKYLQASIAILFRKRLTIRIHEKYFQNRAYYVASQLGGLQHADQRIADDVKSWADAVAELYSYTLKPCIDLVIFTRSLARAGVGWKSQGALYLYFLAASGVLRSISPPLALMTAQESALSGIYRASQQRVVTFAEEIAYTDPPSGAWEKSLLNGHLGRLLRHARLSALIRAVQSVADGYLVKYLASVVGLLVFAAPLYFTPSAHRRSKEEIAGSYVRSMRLMMNTSSAIGQLVLVYKRVLTLSGHTSRVAELLEQVQALSRPGQHALVFAALRRLKPTDAAADAAPPPLPPPPGRVIESAVDNAISFDHVDLQSPDGTTLVRDLTATVKVGRNVMLVGPNGSGKSSLLRVLGELWPPAAGTVTRPPRRDLLFLSQRPYLVSGTLRDQVVYPYAVLPTAAGTPAALPRQLSRGGGGGGKGTSLALSITAKPQSFGELSTSSRGDDDLDEDERARLDSALERVELGYLRDRGAKGWNTLQKWEETLSGGERQRLAFARLLFHKPKFAVLDEATSAVSADGEVLLYKAVCGAGITLLSVAHRPALRRFHQDVLIFDGSLSGSGWRIERLDLEPEIG